MGVRTSGDNRRIAKNTLFLYFRQLVTMAVSLYTVRAVLDVLGAEDYGIYNVVGGVVALFSFLSATMASATQRFLSFEMGKGEGGFPVKVFSVSVRIYLLLSGIILLLSETLGLWFVNVRLTIPEARLTAANFVYQSSVLSFAVTLLCIPYNASIIAMERMKVFAYSSLMDSVLKLLVVLALPCLASDHLATYAVLTFAAVSSVQVYYVWYCRRRFAFCRYGGCADGSSLFRDMLSFAGWNMIGALANILRGQGLNILINLFFAPIVNAAYGIAMQVGHAVTNFANNFYTAVRPQLVKLYAAGNRDEMLELGYRSSRFAFYLILVVSVPLLLNTEEILGIWLKKVPEYTALFVRITVVSSLVEVLAMPLVNMLQASGKIKAYQATVSILFLLNIPISYALFRHGARPEISLWVSLLLVTLSILPRLYICKLIIRLPIREYSIKVLARIAVTLMPIVLFLRLFEAAVPHVPAMVSMTAQVVSSSIIIYVIGLNKNERTLIVRQVKRIVSCMS